MATEYSDTELKALCTKGWQYICTANAGKPVLLYWRIRVGNKFTSLVLTYTDGEGCKMQHGMIL